MDWLSPGQVFGYLGAAGGLFNVWLLGRSQKTSRLYWCVSVAANFSWLAAGYLMGSGAVLAEGFLWSALVFRGWYRFEKGIRA